MVAQVLSPDSPLSDDRGFLLQWGEVATSAGVEPIEGTEVNIEAIAAARPDVIIGNSFGRDAVTDEVYELLSEVAPTVVLDYSALSWQELAAILGPIVGQQSRATEVVDQFDDVVAELATDIDTSKPVVAAVISEQGVNVFTAESPQGQLLSAMGLDVVSPEGGQLEGEAGAATRSDVVSVSPELIPDTFGDATVLFVFAEQPAIDAALDQYPTLAATPAAAESRLVPLGVESFRLDRYSAELMAERVAAALAR
ncbi:MAG: Fe2+-enterobactin ABC transporter substrate-binding protein [Actinomycetota bacterium]